MKNSDEFPDDDASGQSRHREAYTESEFTDYAVYDAPDVKFRTSNVNECPFSRKILCHENYLITTTAHHPLRIEVRNLATLDKIYVRDLKPAIGNEHSKKGFDNRENALRTANSLTHYQEVTLEFEFMAIDTVCKTEIDLLSCSPGGLFLVFGSSIRKSIQIHSLPSGDLIARINDTIGGFSSIAWLDLPEHMRLITFSEHRVSCPYDDEN
jgi:hypothetical protein